MGSSVSCVCDPSSTTKRQVLVMKEDGELLKFKEGTRVKDVLVARPYHKVVKCCSDRTVLPESFQLTSNQLYFLLPRGLAVHDETYNRLLSLAASRHPKYSIICTRRNYGYLPAEGNSKEGLAVVEASKNMTASDDNYSGYYKSRWEPALLTIPEVTSPSTLHAHA